MGRERRKSDGSDAEPFWSSVFFLSFGIALLLFLVAIEHQNWFTLKPATGTAEAMSYASAINGTKS
ncbi:hypothetical protein [Sphingomonas jeddahensis]|uniref:Uncharacterized protein n=1 Tax=Sphingomonas jeddahensis TaxID=1915074 RepID=A0A1V2EVY8_9SPHN|nr:hypothetical protein [Sphingomonas jeddahensis]ONF96645.1 hypothetical protein SPHI_08390 [Sphingomonas jeddahensis]